ncbi:MAG: hypothetical protein QM737_14150 [Ferruginibacter sp.]
MQKFIFPFFFIGSITMALVVTMTGALLTTDKTPHGILDLELAYNVSKVDTVIKAWSPAPMNTINKIEVAKINTWWDFLFLVFYAPFLFIVCKKISRSYKTGSMVSKAGIFFAKIILLAGVFDAIENIGMFQSLNGNISSTTALFTASVSFIKWGIVVCCLLFIILSFPRAIYLSKKKV